jgi:hypothetical protein
VWLRKNPSEKGAGGVAQGVGPEIKPQYHKQTTKQAQSFEFKLRSHQQNKTKLQLKILSPTWLYVPH